MQPPTFLFLTCQVGAEAAVKKELSRRWPDFRFAYSRPGFLTFKLPAEHRLPPEVDLDSVFARSYGFSLGKAEGDDPEAMARQAWELYGNRPVRRVHVWPRDRAAPGEHGYEPGPSSESQAAREAILQAAPHPDRLASDAANPHVPARRGDMVLDCVLVEPALWWIGFHQAASMASRWPGGMIPLELPAHAVSRAWLKMEEALRWSRLPIPAGARVAEIGAAPGGSSQALLARGLEVLGIDPAEMDQAVLSNPRFRHIRRRVVQVRRREFRKVRWLTADMNVAPQMTLDAVEEIVAHPEINIRGMLLTLKLLQWDLADELPGYLDRIRGWGFNQIRARQLLHNRQEVCVAALQRPFRRKPVVRRG